MENFLNFLSANDFLPDLQKENNVFKRKMMTFSGSWIMRIHMEQTYNVQRFVFVRSCSSMTKKIQTKRDRIQNMPGSLVPA